MTVLIQFEGYLAKLYPEGVQVDGRTPRECLGLLSFFPGFRREDGVRHYVKVDVLDCYAALDTPLVKNEMVVTPMMGGAGGGSARQIVIGALLIGFAWWAAGAFASGSLLAKGAFLNNMVFNIGVSMVLGGIMQHLAKAPKADPTSGDKRSRFISGAANTVAAGTPISLIYGGPIKVGGHFLTFDVDAENYVPE